MGKYNTFSNIEHLSLAFFILSALDFYFFNALPHLHKGFTPT